MLFPSKMKKKNIFSCQLNRFYSTAYCLVGLSTTNIQRKYLGLDITAQDQCGAAVASESMGTFICTHRLITDWLKLREDHRIVGNLTGCLVGLPRQETLQGLPLLLLPEEVTLLVEKNLARFVDDSALSELPDGKTKEQYLKYKEENRKEQCFQQLSIRNCQQIACYEAQRRQQVTTMIDRIIEGKRRKLMGLNTKKKKSIEGSEKIEENAPEVELDREEILRNELNKAAENFSPPNLVHTFTSEHWLNKPESEGSWKFPETTGEKLKYFVFKDLWEKNYYITSGHKFGVDYLVYPGDPVKFHAQFLVVCVEYDNHISTTDFIAYARLGCTSRKTFVIASKLPNKELFYHSIQWTGRNDH